MRLEPHTCTVASKKIANNPIVHTRDSECTYLSISVAPEIITDSAPLALKEKLNTTRRRVTTDKTNWRGSLSETWFWNARNKHKVISTDTNTPLYSQHVPVLNHYPWDNMFYYPVDISITVFSCSHAVQCHTKKLDRKSRHPCVILMVQKAKWKTELHTSLLPSVLLRVHSMSNNANGNKRVIFSPV